MAEQRTMHDMAYFAVVDGPRYLPKAITALRSIQRFQPASGFFVVGALGDDDESLGLVEDHGLEFAHLDLSDVFEDCRSFRSGRFARRHPPRPWPSETFWWLGGPDMFAARGYDHSCVVDGDVFGVASIDLDEVFDGEAPMAGVEKPDGRVNAGVLFFDHARLRGFDLLATARHLYDTLRNCEHPVCTGYCRAKSDQGLLHELEDRRELVVRRIGNEYNHLLHWDERNYLDRNRDAPFGVDESRLLHLLSKPWDRVPPRVRRPNPIMADAYQRWWAFACEIWPDGQERARHFGRQRRTGALR